MYTTVFRRVLLPAYESLRGRRTLAYLAEYERNQWKQPVEIAAIRWAKLRRLLAHCYEHVPYYRVQWDRLGIRWQDISGLDDYRRLPFLTKANIRAHHDELIARPFRGKTITKAAAVVQSAFYAAWLVGRWSERWRRLRLVNFAVVFFELNWAAVLAMRNFITGRIDARWEKTS